MSERKQCAHVEFKNVDKGEIEAVFSRFNVIDADGDVTLPGAFEDGASVRISAYGHGSWHGELPVGRGKIHTTDDMAILKGQFFLSTLRGRETFQTIKEMDDLQEWSYGYDVVKSDPGTWDEQDVRFLKRLKVHEISPVLLGAGVGTRTLSIKKDSLLNERIDGLESDARARSDLLRSDDCSYDEEQSSAARFAWKELVDAEYAKFQATRKRLGL